MSARTPHFANKQFVEIDDCQIAYLDQGSGPPVLLGHAYLWDSEMWRPQIDVLSQHFRVLAPDLFGHGRSDGLPLTLRSLDDLARWHTAFLDALDIPQCHIVGSSVGGMWAARLAMHAPERVDRLVMLGSGLGAEPDTQRMRYAQIMNYVAINNRFDAHAIDTIGSLFFHPNGRTVPTHRRAFAHQLAQYKPAALRESLIPIGRMIFDRADALDRVSELNRDRTLVVCGERDTPRPPAESRAMAELIGCRHVLVPDAGHIANLEKPEFITDTLLTWLMPALPKATSTPAASALSSPEG